MRLYQYKLIASHPWQENHRGFKNYGDTDYWLILDGKNFSDHKYWLQITHLSVPIIQTSDSTYGIIGDAIFASQVLKHYKYYMAQLPWKKIPLAEVPMDMANHDYFKRTQNKRVGVTPYNGHGTTVEVSEKQLTEVHSKVEKHINKIDFWFWASFLTLGATAIKLFLF